MKKFLGVIRFPFLLLTPICVFVGIAVAMASPNELDWGNLIAVMVAAMSAHMSVNALNEYVDFKSGLDLQTQRTPFSGGSGVLASYPDYANATLVIGVVTLVITIVAGFYLIYHVGPGLLPLGLLGVLIVLAYTPWINQYPLVCLLAPGIGFGVIMVLGTQYALSKGFTAAGFWAAVVPTCLVSALLLLNQFPDVEADRRFGRNHLPIRIGRQGSAVVYGVLLLLAFASILLAVLMSALPVHSLLAMLGLPAALILLIQARRNANNIPQLVPWLGINVILVLATPALLGLGIFSSVL